jgi:hypothetical protein
VIRKSHRKAGISRQILCEWFIDCFVTKIKKYCNENNIAFKVLLVLENALAYDVDFVSLCLTLK